MAATKLSSAAMPSCDTAIAIAPRNRNQKASEPIRLDGRTSGATRFTYCPVEPECSARSMPTFSSSLVTTPLTTRAMM